MPNQRGFRTIQLQLPKRRTVVPVYTSARVADALEEIRNDATLYQGVRIAQIMEAVYWQGRKDGARMAFEGIDHALTTVKSDVPHGRPGRPRKPVRKRAARRRLARATARTTARKPAARKAVRKSARRKTTRKR